MRRVSLLALGLCALVGVAAWAHAATPDSENGRYTFKQIGEELLRLDGRTGQVSQCSKRAAGWACLTVPDERTALEAEIVRLQTETAALKKELLNRGIPLPSGSSAPQTSSESGIKLPSDADVDRVMGFMEKVWRRFVDMVRRERG